MCYLRCVMCDLILTYYIYIISHFLSHTSQLVEIKGVEPLTSCLQGRRSSQLSYTPIYKNQCTKYIEK